MTNPKLRINWRRLIAYIGVVFLYGIALYMLYTVTVGLVNLLAWLVGAWSVVLLMIDSKP